MPNWCMNSVTIRHDDPAMIDRAFQALTRSEFLNEFIPVPQALLDTEAGSVTTDQEAAHQAQEAANLAEHGSANWYDWCTRHWGTKWDVGDADSTEKLDANTIEASFDSAWAPPCAAYERLCGLGFEIQAYYNEPGMAFCGKWTGSGDHFDDNYCEYSHEDAESVRSVIGDELDDFWCISENMAHDQSDLDWDDDELLDTDDDSDRDS